ncbi:MAG: HAMP domain-containing sensor histidine kinase [Rhizomicrobium sp.]|jgi:signal transduction histidine kinase
MTWRFKSILSRIIWLHVLAFAIAALAMPLATYFLLNATANEFENRTLQAHARDIEGYLKLDGSGRWQLSLPADLRTFYLHSFDGFAYSIVDSSNKVLFSSLHDKAEGLARGSAPDSPSYFQRRSGKAVYYGASFPYNRGGRAIFIQVAQNLEHPDVIIDDIVADYLLRVSWFTIPIMLLLLLTDILIVRRALGPVTHASDMARAIDPGRIDLRLPVDGVPTEVLPLVVAVNQALDRLEKGFRAQRDFTADAAHELRTPLAVLRMRVETLPDQDAVTALRTDLETMTHVVNQLLEVAELEASVVDLKEMVDLRDVCADVVAALAPMAIEQRKDIALTGSERPVPVKGNSVMLHQAVRNLAENALRHTPVGTMVEINVAAGGAVRVLDEGPGVALGERELIFRRFWRRDRSRSHGAGLGLAIVARIIEAHAGKIEVANRPTGGAVFSLTLPRFHPAN